MVLGANGAKLTSVYTGSTRTSAAASLISSSRRVRLFIRNRLKELSTVFRFVSVSQLLGFLKVSTVLRQLAV